VPSNNIGDDQENTHLYWEKMAPTCAIPILTARQKVVCIHILTKISTMFVHTKRKIYDDVLLVTSIK